MNSVDLIDILHMNHVSRPREQFWWHEAHRAYHRGAYEIITRPWTTNPYMARFWLTGDVANSGNCALLHWILLPDVGPLHDHPWDFTSLGLEGWYTENRLMQYGVDHRDLRTDRMRPGECFVRKAGAIHAVTDVSPDGCWTMVLTAPHSGRWNFYPDGKPINSRDYKHGPPQDASSRNPNHAYGRLYPSLRGGEISLAAPTHSQRVHRAGIADVDQWSEG